MAPHPLAHVAKNSITGKDQMHIHPYPIRPVGEHAGTAAGSDCWKNPCFTSAKPNKPHP